MSSSKRYQLRLLAEVIAYKLYDAHLDDAKRDRHAVADIQSMFSTVVSRRFIESCLGYLRTVHYAQPITRSGTSGSYTYRISGKGILFVEQMLKDKSSLITYYAENGDDALDLVAGFEAAFHMQDEAFDGASNDWRPISLDRETDEYKSFERSLERGIQAIEESNEFAAKFVEERKEILRTLHAGREQIGQQDVSPRYIHRFIVDPLKWVAVQFAKTTLGAAANMTLQEVVHFISRIV